MQKIFQKNVRLVTSRQALLRRLKTADICAKHHNTANINGALFEAKTTIDNTKYIRTIVHNNAYKIVKFHNYTGEHILINQHSFLNIMMPKCAKSAIIYGCHKPDEAIFTKNNQRLIVVEKKYKKPYSSPTQILQTAPIKQQHMQRDMFPHLNVQYIYCLSSAFKEPKYISELNMLKDYQIPYYFEDTYPQQLLHDFYNDYVESDIIEV